MCRNDGNGHAARVGLHPFDEFEAVAVRQPHIRQAEIKLVVCELLLGRPDVGGRLGIDVHTVQSEIQELTNVRLIINYEC